LTREPLSGDDQLIVAIASDGEMDTGVLPGFDVNDIGAIADFITGHLGLEKK
jgi:molybdopterin-guanine dinucleotide biosynthesis protein B